MEERSHTHVAVDTYAVPRMHAEAAADAESRANPKAGANAVLLVRGETSEPSESRANAGVGADVKPRVHDETGSHPHTHAEAHHHHTHAATSHHVHGHHLLQISHLSVGFRMYDADAPYFSAKQRMSYVIDDLSISVHEGEIVAVVGASGSGKTLLADSIMGLFEPNADVRGEVWLDGQLMDAAALARARGHGISIVPQSVSHLDPLMRVGRQVEGFGPRSERVARRQRRKELFGRYGLDEAAARMYPHELSGGMARRVLLCCALMDDPKVIVADEPTPGLDLDLAVKALADFRAFADAGGGVMLITHDIELALRVADRVAVFKDGTIVEETAVANFASPDTLEHPFAKALWQALPEHGFGCGEGAGSSPYSGSSESELQDSSSKREKTSVHVPSSASGGESC